MDRGDPSGAIGFSGDDRSTRLAHARLQPLLQRQGGIGPPANRVYRGRKAQERRQLFRPTPEAALLTASSLDQPLILQDPRADSSEERREGQGSVGRGK